MTKRPKENLKKAVSVSLDDDLIERLDQRSYQKDMSRSELIRIALERYLAFPPTHNHQRKGKFWEKVKDAQNQSTLSA